MVTVTVTTIIELDPNATSFARVFLLSDILYILKIPISLLNPSYNKVRRTRKYLPEGIVLF